tara:strand:+ start:333 stop:605 length:273 start_codon:yes stop_codon:yes gene_type:complete
MKQKNLHNLVREIQQEMQELIKAREKLIEIKKQMTEAGFSEDQACRKLATAIDLDFRTVKNWLRKQSHLQEAKLLKVLLFLDAYKEVIEE